VWSGGVRAFDALLPGVVDSVVGRGGRLVHIMGDMISRAPNEVWFRRFTSNHHQNLVCSRDLLDSVLRERVLAQDHIVLREDTTALGLEGTAKRVAGVRVRTGDEETVLTADLVIDASGRGSHAASWLTGLGLPRVEEVTVDAGLAYATRIYRAPGKTATMN
ncbi:pyridine nucleotide-disulfide oxidoreductase, partial [Streptomyces sp. TRM76130]|nr:pyridine nucleotide-disulfide oxidoreductase [Streptomyces sp. TRM76130]